MRDGTRSRVAATLDTAENRFNPVTDYMRIKLHEQTGAVFAVEGQKDGVTYSDSGTLNGAPTDAVWTGNPGWFTNEGDNQDNLLAITEAYDVCTPANYPNGGHLYLLPTWLASGRVQDGTLPNAFQFGRQSNTTVGGVGLRFTNAGNVNWQVYQARIGASNIVQGQAVITSLEDQAIPCWGWMPHGRPDEGRIGITGSFSAGTAVDYGANGGTLPVQDPAFGVAFNSSITSGPGASNIVNAGTIALSFHDFWVIAFDEMPTTAQLTAIIADYAANPYENLTSIP